MNNKKKRNERSNLGRWPSLPNDILVTIVELLTSPDGTDFIRFGAVCRSWRSAAAKVTHTLVRQMPWIMLPARNKSREIGIYNLSENKSYNFRLPKKKWIHVCGSVNGWVAVELKKHIFVVNLNPWQHPRVRHLPPLEDPITYSVRKLCLPMSPIENPDGMALTIYGVKRYNSKVPIGTGLAFAKLGSRAWATISCSKWAPYNDAVSYKGTFYAVNNSGVVVELDLQRQQAAEIASLPTASLSVSAIKKCYLVESAGDLLQVVLYNHNRLKVFKMDIGSGEWEPEKSLGERSLFVGWLSYSISVEALQLSRCMPNCIYLIDEENYDSRYVLILYSLQEDKEIEKSTIAPVNNFESCPLWVSPFFEWQASDSSSDNI